MLFVFFSFILFNRKFLQNSLFESCIIRYLFTTKLFYNKHMLNKLYGCVRLPKFSSDTFLPLNTLQKRWTARLRNLTASKYFKKFFVNWTCSSRIAKHSSLNVISTKQSYQTRKKLPVFLMPGISKWQYYLTWWIDGLKSILPHTYNVNSNATLLLLSKEYGSILT